MNIPRHVRHLRASTVVASLALFVALGGSATAATLITGAQIKNGTITGKDVKNSTLTGSKVKNGSLSASDLSRTTKGSLKGANGDTGSAGPAGSGGAPGALGTPGPNGVATPQTATASANIQANGVNSPILEKVVPAGGYMVTVKGYLFSPDVTHVTCRLFNGVAQVDRVDWDAAAADLRQPVFLAGVATVSNGPLRVECVKSGAGAGALSLTQLTAIPTS